MNPAAHPIPESYWVEPGRFLAGEYPGHPLPEESAKRITALLDAGVDTFFDLTQEGELESYESLVHEKSRAYPERHIRYQRFPIGDFGIPAKMHMKKILDAIEAALAEQRILYLHCWGGVGRTGTTVGCYLVRKGKTGEQALQQLERWWQTVPKHIYSPRSPETDEQVRFILGWRE